MRRWNAGGTNFWTDLSIPWCHIVSFFEISRSLRIQPGRKAKSHNKWKYSIHPVNPVGVKKRFPDFYGHSKGSGQVSDRNQISTWYAYVCLTKNCSSPFWAETNPTMVDFIVRPCKRALDVLSQMEELIRLGKSLLNLSQRNWIQNDIQSSCSIRSNWLESHDERINEISETGECHFPLDQNVNTKQCLRRRRK